MRGRELLGRVDFWWPDLHLVGEFDGRLKYRAELGGARAKDTVWREKLREDALRALGLRIVRWTWDDALHPARLVRILAAAGVYH